MEAMRNWMLTGIVCAVSWMQVEAQAAAQSEDMQSIQLVQGVPAGHVLQSVQGAHDERIRRVEQYLEELAQDMAQDMTEGDDGGNVQMALEYFEQLLERPLNINKVTRGDLERLFLLSDFQITSLLTYRQEHGDILSGTELSLLNGFNEWLAELLREFFVFEADVVQGRIKSSGSFFKDCYSTLLLKGNRVLEREEWYMPITQDELEKKPDSRYLGTPYYMQLKYKCEYLGRIQVGFTLENDAGERVLSPMKIPMGDFFSFHMALRDLRIGRKNGRLEIANLILGDFSARFGQGLTLWNSFSLMTTSSAQGFYKRGAAIVPYTSSDENNFLRGAAVTVRKGIGHEREGAELEMTAVFSHHGLDASVNDYMYTSIIAGGLHNTFSSYKTRKAMVETVGGVNAVVRFKKFKIGASWTSYGYTKENGRRVQEYNKFQMYNGTWGNFSTDFYAIIRGVRFWGELAMDYGGSFAALAGGIFNIDNLEVGVLARSYSKSYIAAHANAYSTISSCSNQTGVAVNMAYPLSKLFRLSGNLDFAYYPWMRFNIPESSSILKMYVKLEYMGAKINGYLRFADSYSTYGGANKVGLRGMLGWSLCRNLIIKVRGEIAGKTSEVIQVKGGKGMQLGYDAAVDVDYKFWKDNLRVQVRGAYFNTGGWDTRLYMYEADLPHSFTSQLLYGTGFRGYLLMQLKVMRRFDIYAKLDTVQYSKRGEDSKIPAPLSKIKLGLKMSF